MTREKMQRWKEKKRKRDGKRKGRQEKKKREEKKGGKIQRGRRVEEVEGREEESWGSWPDVQGNMWLVESLFSFIPQSIVMD